MEYIFYSDELSHYGIPNQKHGVRRFQYPDGSLTPAGRIRYGVGKAREKSASGAKAKVASSKDQERAAARAKRIEARKAKKDARIAEKNARKEAERKREQDAKELQRYEELRRKPASKLTAAEMAELTARLTAEKQYKELLRATEEPKLFDGKKFVVDVLQDSGKKILSGAITYGAGKVINSIVGDEVFKVGNNDSKKQDTGNKENTENKQNKEKKQNKENKENKENTENKQNKQDKQNKQNTGNKENKSNKEKKPQWEVVSEPKTQKANDYERAPSEPIDVEWEEVFDSRNVPPSGANAVNRILLTSGSTPLLMLPEPRKRS